MATAQAANSGTVRATASERWALPILLCSAVHSAPQDSDITYVKIQPLDTNPKPPPVKESSIDQIPQGNQTENTENPKEVIIDEKFTTETQSTTSTTSKLDLTSLDPVIGSIDPSIINKLNRIATDDPTRPNQNERRGNQSETNEAYRFVRSDITAAYETTTDLITETDLPQTKKYEARTRPPLRYLSKLSYYKSTAAYGGSDLNLLERGGKRRFRSKCRCEKIWNCPKLQITVPRCPDEYFLCC